VSVYEIEIQDEFGAENFPTERVINAVSYVLQHHDIETGTALTVVVTTDETVRDLNIRFRNVDAPTDVLSFPADPLPDEIDDEGPYLGDLIIAYPYTMHQAQEAQHKLDDELVLLVIHGTLHLLGYDHDNAENQDEMWTTQANILRKFDVAIEVPRFTFGDE
jgi:probable rRNA maturation factor